MSDDHEQVRRDWQIPDELWECIQPLLPPRQLHLLGCHRPRVDDRRAMDAIFFVLHPSCQGNALPDTGICSSRSGPSPLPGVDGGDIFLALWEQGLLAYEALQGMTGRGWRGTGR